MAHRTGTGGVRSPGRSRLRRPRRTAPGRAPRSSRAATSRPWSMASGRRSRTGRPRRRTIRARSSRRRSPTSSATRSRRRTHGRTCSSGGGAHGRLRSFTLPASARGHRRPPADRTTPCRAGVGHAPHRVDRARGTPDSAGLGRIGSGRQPAGAWVSSTSHATTARGRPPRRWSAVLVDGDRDALHRDRVVVPGAPVLSLLTACQVERLACTHSRPIRPRSGLDFTRSERRRSRRGGRRPRPDLELRSGLHPEAVKGDGHGMGGEPLPLRRRTRPA